jgi:TetR/AcrR family fatty acid metabolism transcriptional regulator
MVKAKNWDPGAKKRLLIDAAIKVLNKKEYSKAPVDEIAKCAGVAKGTVYLYFKSKEEIYFSVLFALMDKMKEIIDETTKTEVSATKQMSLMLMKNVEFVSKHSHIFNALMNEITPHKDKFHSEIRKRIFEMNEAVASIVKKGIERNEFKNYPPALISGVFFSAASLIAHQQIENDKTYPPIPPEMLFEILFKGFGK